MDREIARLRPVTLVMPKPVGTATIRGRTKKETLARVEKLTKRGYVLEASPLAQFHARAGGGFGVKVALAKPLPQPMPGWAKGLALVGASLSVLAFVGTLLVNAIAALLGVAAGIAWGGIIGAGVVALVVLAALKRFVFGGITINQTVNFK